MHLNTNLGRTSAIEYRTLFVSSGIYHANVVLQTTHNMYVTGYFLLLFDVTPDRGASEGHTSHPDSGNIRIDIKFAKILTVPFTCLFTWNKTIGFASICCES